MKGGEGGEGKVRGKCEDHKCRYRDRKEADKWCERRGWKRLPCTPSTHSSASTNHMHLWWSVYSLPNWLTIEPLVPFNLREKEGRTEDGRVERGREGWEREEGKDGRMGEEGKDGRMGERGGEGWEKGRVRRGRMGGGEREEGREAGREERDGGGGGREGKAGKKVRVSSGE